MDKLRPFLFLHVQGVKVLLTLTHVLECNHTSLF